MQKQYRYSEGFLQFGSTVDTKSFLYYIVIKDLNKNLIKLPFRDNSYQEITIKRLAQLYLLQTSCKKLLTSKPAFRALEGDYQGQIIPQQLKLFSLGMNISKPCLQVQESSTIDQQESLYLTNKIKNKTKIQEISIKITYSENSYEQKLAENEKISKLKEHLLKKKQFFKATIDMIQLRYGEIILDNQNCIKEYNMINGSIINATIIKKQGCFRGNLKVRVCGSDLEHNNEAIQQKCINEVKVGDSIISYNQQKQIFQRDQVTGIHQSLVDELIEIILEDKNAIQTTPNHLFLCHDNQYRKLHYSSERISKLQQGMLLKTSNDLIKILSIKPKRLPQKQYFYHLLIKNNHNYFINDVIVHNMFIKIDYEKHLQQLNVSEKQTIGSIKKLLENSYKRHNSSCMKLVYNGQELKNTFTLSDLNIKKESKLNLAIKNVDQFNYFHGETKIKLKEGYKSIKDLCEGDQISLYLDQDNFNLLSFKPTLLKMKQIPEYFIMELTSGQRNFVLNIYGDTYLELQNGQSKCISEIYEQYLLKNKISLKSLKKSINILKITLKKQKNKNFFNFYKLIFQPQEKYGYIIQQQIVIHNDIIHFYFQNQVLNKHINLSTNSKTKISEFKNKICKVEEINLNQETKLNFICHEKILAKNATFMEEGVKFEDIVIVTASKHIQSKLFIEDFIQEEQQRKVYLKTENNEEYQLDYQSNKDKTVKQTMKILIPNYKSSFFFMFGGCMLQPKDPLSMLQKAQYFNQHHNIVLVIKNQRLSFIMNMNILGSQIKNQSQYQLSVPISATLQLQSKKELQETKQYKQAKARIQNNKSISNIYYRQQQFYKPFLYYTSSKYKDDIDHYIRNFETHLKECNQTDHQRFIFKLIKNLYINIGYLPNYIEKPLQETYFGMRNFRMSLYFQKNQTFYWYSFLKTTGNQKLVLSQLQGSSGTLYHIISTTGKVINDYSFYPPQKDKQLLFLPYTYFLINKIVKSEHFDEVWLTQIASPTSFQKNIILWVDDIPFNNIEEVYEVQRESDIEIIQLVSTLSAEKWLKQFGWLLTWKNINFKLITDNFREQYTEKDEGIVKVSKAGFELLMKIYLKHGMTTKCCIYTGNSKTAETVLLQSYPLIKDRYKSSFWIGDLRKQILDFCKQP